MLILIGNFTCYLLLIILIINKRATREKYIRMKYQDKKFILQRTETFTQLNNKLYNNIKQSDTADILKLIVQGIFYIFNLYYHF